VFSVKTVHTPNLVSPVSYQFWVAYVSCKSQYKDAVEQTLEQIDVIKRLIQKYSDHLELVTTSDGIINVM